MASTDTSDVGSPAANESKAQEQARFRRERRNAKIQAGGSARLNKITSLSGRPAVAEAGVNSAPSGRQSNLTSTAQTEDPAEVDISTMFERPSQEPPNARSQEDLLRQMLAGAPNNPQTTAINQTNLGEEDPMLRLMQQLMGPERGDDLPPGLAAMMGGQQQSQPQGRSVYVWSIIHTIFSLLLGLYAAFKLPFTGSEFARRQVYDETSAPKIFWIFTIVELLLQSSRFFLERGKLPVSGTLGGLSQMLPEPYANLIRVWSRYSIIYAAVVTDAMVVVFVLGCKSWWTGLAAT